MASPPRAVALSDRRLAQLAADTAATLRWGRLLRASAQWKWIKNTGDFSLYTRHDAGRFAVLAVGLVDASIAELASLLTASSNEQHEQRCEVLLGDEFKGGALVHEVDLAGVPPPSARDTTAALAQLAVKTATFDKPSMLAHREEWCFLEAVFAHASGQVFEKHLTSIEAKDVLTGKSGKKTKEIQNVVGGYYCVQGDHHADEIDADEDVDSLVVTTSGGSTKVHFYAELNMTNRSGELSSAVLTHSATRSRLIRFAQSCSRLSSLVHRRRLGAQVLVDSNRILPPTNVPCFSCDKQLLVAKLCRMCGCGVCGDCSSKYERERKSRSTGRLRIESVRICVYCIRRVDAADYSHLGDASFSSSVHVVPDSESSTPASIALTTLLQDALKSAKSDERLASVVNVIKCVLEDKPEPEPEAKLNAASARKQSTLADSVEDYVRGLLSLNVPKVPHTQAKMAESTGRAYPLDPKITPDGLMPHPVPVDDAQRVQTIRESRIRDLDNAEELVLICQMAARELDCFASLISLVDQDDLIIMASSLPSLGLKKLERNSTFCGHTVMSRDPLVIPHPEADVRFHQCILVDTFGVKYYCGFPIIARGAVVGALCCVDLKTRELTESHYSYLLKLAETAGKFITLHAEKAREAGRS